jgi:hypothetical protein
MKKKIQAVENAGNRIAKSKDDSIKFLQKVGIIGKDLKLTDEYK